MTSMGVRCDSSVLDIPLARSQPLSYIDGVDRAASPRRSSPHRFHNMTCLLTWGAVVLLFPLILLLWITETKQQKARRWRSAGHTYRTIADRLHVSPTTARRYAMS